MHTLMRPMSVVTLVVACCLPCAPLASDQLPKAAARTVPELRALLIESGPPTIDGRLDEPVWLDSHIDFGRDFLQREPDEGHSASESTLIAVVYDDRAIFVGIWAFDSEPEKIIGRLARRDRNTESDEISLIIDPYHDHRNGYCFRLNPAGVKRDERLYKDTQSDDSWDAVWDGASEYQPWGWSAEFRIPYHCLRFPDKVESTWGFNVVRNIRRKAESDWWSYAPKSEYGLVSVAGHLTDLQGIESTRPLKVLPYGIGRMETEPKRLGNTNGRDLGGSLGVDVKYGLTSDLTLDATVNPDFGQVELDQPVLNLSTYETLYQERRPFFVEGAELFRTRFSLFYSRRIGRAPNGYPEDDEFDHFIHKPSATTILGAAKVTGRMTGGTSIAFLNAFTDTEYADYATTVGQLKRGQVESRANCTAVRVKQDVFSNSSIGVTATAAAQDGERPVTTGGADWRLLTPNRQWSFSGQGVFSSTEDGISGLGLDAEIRKEAGTHFTGYLRVLLKDRYLDLNRMGYLDRNNLRRGSTGVQYHTTKGFWVVRYMSTNFNYRKGWNYDGYNVDRQWNLSSYFLFRNDWNLNIGFARDFPEYDDRESRAGLVVKRPPYEGWWFDIGTSRRAKWWLNLRPSGAWNRNGTNWTQTAQIGYNLTNIQATASLVYVRDFGMTYWAGNSLDTTYFADLDRDELQIELSASMMLNRDLSVQLSGLGVIAGLDYANYRRRWSGLRYAVPITLYEDLPSGLSGVDRNYSAFNSMFLLRWEYSPGSTLYLVWTRVCDETDYGVNNLDLSRDVERFFSAGSENVFLIKVSYWTNL